MPWLYLIFAVLLDVAGTICLKVSNGLTRLVPTVLMIVFYGAGFLPLALALKTMQVGLVYAVWSALGTALVVAVGIIWFKEPVSSIKVLSLALITVGLILLNISARPQW